MDWNITLGSLADPSKESVSVEFDDFEVVIYRGKFITVYSCGEGIFPVILETGTREEIGHVTLNEFRTSTFTKSAKK